MEQIKKEMAEIVIMGNEANKALQEHIKASRRLDEVDDIIAKANELMNGNVDNKSSYQPMIDGAESTREEIELDIEKKMMLNPESIMTEEEYSEKLDGVADSYYKLVQENEDSVNDVVVRIKTMKGGSDDILDRMVSRMEISNPLVKRIYQNKYEGMTTFDTNNVFVMPLTEYKNFMKTMKSDKTFKHTVNPFFNMPHINQEISPEKMSEVLNEDYKDRDLEFLFRTKLGLGIHSLTNDGMDQPEKVPVAVREFFRKTIEEEHHGLAYENEKDNDYNYETNLDIQPNIRYQDTKKKVTLFSEAKRKIESDKQEQKNDLFNDLETTKPEGMTKKKAIKNRIR